MNHHHHDPIRELVSSARGWDFSRSWSRSNQCPQLSLTDFILYLSYSAYLSSPIHTLPNPQTREQSGLQATLLTSCGRYGYHILRMCLWKHGLEFTLRGSACIRLFIRWHWCSKPHTIDWHGEQDVFSVWPYIHHLPTRPSWLIERNLNTRLVGVDKRAFGTLYREIVVGIGRSPRRSLQI